MRTRHWDIPFALGVCTALFLLLRLDGAGARDRHSAGLSKAQGPACLPARASGDVITVCLSGGCDYISIQDAVDGAAAGNVIISNTAGEMGGGLSLDNESDATFERNVILSNTARVGGGLYLYALSDARLTNDALAGNRAGLGSGLYVLDCSSRLVHTTIAGCGDGIGIFVSDTSGIDGASTVAITNAILVDHNPAILAATGNSVTLNGVLWYGNTANYAHVGRVIVTNEYTGSPAFALDGYHLTVGSAAIDRGVGAGVDEDMDGGPRPVGAGYDLGADEFPAAVRRGYVPVVMRQHSALE